MRVNADASQSNTRFFGNDGSDVGHDADVIAHMSDRAALMSEGKIQRFFDRDAMEKGEHRMD